MKPTAQGYYLGIHPDFRGGEDWYVVSFDKRGFWRSASIHASRAEAIKHRRWLIAHHARLAKQQEQRLQKRKLNRKG